MIDFLSDILDLIVSFIPLDFLEYWFLPIVCLAFLATVPAIFRHLTMWR